MLVYIHYVCLACRRCAKRQPLSCHDEYTPLKCAECEAAMFCVGKHFTAPPRRDDKQWKKLAWMIENGWRGAVWPTTPAMNEGEVREALRESRETRAAEAEREKEKVSFERAQLQARWNFRRSRTTRRKERLELEAQQRYQDAVLARVNKP